MDQHSLFSSGAELADLLVNSGLLSCSWEAILDTQQSSPNDPTLPYVKYKVHHPPNGTIIAFVSSPEVTVHHLQTQGRDLVSSEELKGSFNLFDFVATKVNPSFAIHREAVTIFFSLLAELTRLRNQQHDSSSPLIITGHCLGGSIASLFTLWLLDSMLPRSSKRPLCITFGSPLLGDKCFQQAISERPTWNSSFLHVVSNKDLVPHLFIPQTNGVCDGSISQTCTYKPFGTFLLCSESGCACFEEPESILELLMATGSNFVGNPYQHNSLQITDYRPILEVLVHNSIFRRGSLVHNSLTNLQAGIKLQLTAIGVETQMDNIDGRQVATKGFLSLNSQRIIGLEYQVQTQISEQLNFAFLCQTKGHGGDLNSLTTTTAEREKKFQRGKRNVFDPNKKLAERKLDMTYLEWYKILSKDQGGYYDSYKNKQSGSREQIRTRQEIIKRQRILTQYWKRMVSEVEKMPQKEGASFRMRWLYGGTNYRRLIEPLDIADYCKKGHKDYVTRGRSQHYVLLEKWFNDARPVEGAKERNKACSLTEDSCFWAYVEEAIISCKVLKDGQSSSEDKRLSMDNLIGFDRYVMNLIENFAVSPEIFLPESSFMQWWEECRVIIGNLDNSPLADFMRNGYQNYS
ncbi:hypothetical protein Pfo_009052 [Paulownia fortunei]|nr:hypothetical protein Pfo_009052 [Paulownia fortunei]